MAVYLTDKSAWEQLKYSTVAQERFVQLHTGYQLAVCTVVVAELLFSARNHVDFMTQRAEYEALRWLDVDLDVQHRALEVMETLAERGLHRGAGPVDLFVAATAEVHRATVLHYDSDFERI